MVKKGTKLSNETKKLISIKTKEAMKYFIKDYDYICSNCNSSFKRKGKLYNKTQRYTFCNRKCMGEFYSKLMRQKLSSMGFRQGHKGFWTPESAKKASLKMRGHLVSVKTRLKISLNKERALKIKIKNTKNDKINKDRVGKSYNNIYGEIRALQIRKEIQGVDETLWLGFISLIPYGPEFTESLKRKIRERDNYKCFLCGKLGNNVHHIDYNKKNNNEENLITLCQNHHNATNARREYWKERFVEALL